jgi:hypothetical protein
MSIEADLARSDGSSGLRAVPRSGRPVPLAAIAIFSFWEAGTTSRRHAE